MGGDGMDIQGMIAAAVLAAHEAGMRGIDEKIQAAINLALPAGIKIGAEVGSRIGAEIGAAAAVEAVEREQEGYRKRKYEWEYHNTKLLLRNYRRLKKYYENAVFSSGGGEDEAGGSFGSIMRGAGRSGSDEVFVESIQKSYATTKIIMDHVDKMLECYGAMCRQSSRKDDARHWRVLEGLYLSEEYTTAEKIAKREGIEKRTVYRDVDVCVSDLTALLFGVEGLEGI